MKIAAPYEMSRTGKFKEIEGRLELTRGWMKRRMGSGCKWIWVFFCGEGVIENVLKLHSDEGCTTLNILKIIKLYTFKK